LRVFTHFNGEGKLKLYTSCVRNCLIYGSETWPMKEEHEAKSDRNEVSLLGCVGLDLVSLSIRIMVVWT